MADNYLTNAQFLENMSQAKVHRVNKGYVFLDGKRYFDKQLVRYVGRKVFVAPAVKDYCNIFSVGSKRYICSAKEVN